MMFLCAFSFTATIWNGPAFLCDPLPSPFRGLNGTIQTVDIISDDGEEPFCFYLVALEGTQMKEPMWFEYDEVELITSPLVALEA